MPLIDVDGVRINFPFEPYPCQLDYMGKVLECLKTGTNGVLESPTGTGKTLCLLCSSLAWQESFKAQKEFADVTKNIQEQSVFNDLAKSLQNSTGTTWGGPQFGVPKIIYASRTHSQLSQVVQELKRTAYNTVKVSVIGSRDQLCIHEQIKKEQNNTNKVHMCKAKVKTRTCFYYNTFDNLKNNSEARVLMGNVVDIEDLVSYGQKNKVCPYYMSRELKSDADIIFMPYNYLLDAKTRQAQGIDLHGNIVIFDEAHNVEKICEENSSFDLKPGDLATAMEELTRLAEKFVEMEKGDFAGEDDHDSNLPVPDFTVADLLNIKASLRDLEDQIDQIAVPNNGKGATKPGIFMFELLAKVNISFGNKAILIDVLDKIVQYVNQEGSSIGMTKGAGLSKVVNMLKTVFSQETSPGKSLLEHQEKLARAYKVHIQKDDSNKKKKTMDLWTNSGNVEKSGKTLSYWCFSPGHSMQDLVAHGIKCIILTSGTLSPLSSFTAELQIPFPVQLENPHVIQKHQVTVGTLKKGPDGTVLNSNYETRFTPAYQASLGNCIVNFARVVPNGLLIFFPSYPVMEKSLEYWKENNIWSRIEQYKQIFVESRMKGVLNDMMNDFYEKINNPALNGAIFIAVCRGKVSEGLDFSDINGRAVVITGLPYPPYMDPKVVLKMQYLDEMKGKQGYQSLSGKEWYKQQASRAVNQAIGRVIRHKDDFGAILLCDSRFAAPDAIKQLPVWVRPHVNKYDNFGQVVKDTMVFFKTAEKLMPAPRSSKKGTSAGAAAGASFMPTASRQQRVNNLIQPSHAVANHVPSLKFQNEQISVSQLKDEYKGAYTTTKTPKGEGLFSLLENTERQFQFSDTQIPSFQSGQTSDAVMRKPLNKKKIVIKKRGSESAPNERSTCTEVSNKVSMSHVNTAENYIAEVKSTLPSESYKRFSKALVNYKKTEDLGQVCEILADLFTDDDKKHLFAKFYKFVRAKHKKEFHELCEQLTGLQTDYKAEDGVNRKRLQETNELGCLAKKQKIGNSGSVGNMKNSKDTSKSNTASGHVLHSGDTTSSKSVETVLKSTSVILNKENGGKMNVPQKSSKGVKCCMCKEEAKVPFRALCDHICCMNCWRKVFETNKLCPGCGQGVRRRHLVQIHFKMEEEGDVPSS